MEPSCPSWRIAVCVRSYERCMLRFKDELHPLVRGMEDPSPTPPPGYCCLGCQVNWQSLISRWTTFQQIRGLPPTPLIHRCRYSQFPGRDDCDSDHRYEHWEIACPTAWRAPSGSLQRFNGFRCFRCNFNLQFCYRHKWASPATHPCRGCMYDTRPTELFTIQFLRKLGALEGSEEQTVSCKAAMMATGMLVNRPLEVLLLRCQGALLTYARE